MLLTRLGMVVVLSMMFHGYAQSEEGGPVSPWSFTLGGHQNWLKGDDYFEFGSAQASDKEQHKMGWEAGVFYDVSTYVPRWSVSIELVDVGRLGSNAATCDTSLACLKRTEIEQTWIMANAHYLVQQNSRVAFYGFAGGSYVFSRGEVLNQSWDNNAMGAQVGMRLVLHEPTLFDPYLGVRLARMDVESTDEATHIYNMSLIFGIQY